MVLGQETRMLMSVFPAVTVGFLLLGITYIVFPNKTPRQMPTPKPVPSVLGQIISAILWIGLAAAVEITIVGAVFLVNRIRNRKSRAKEATAVFDFGLRAIVKQSFDQHAVFLFNLSHVRSFFQ